MARYWAVGKGGFQRRFPIDALRKYLPTTAPLFAEDADRAQLLTRGVWIYFVREREAFGDGPIKIGQTHDRARRGAGYRTDNPREFEVLLWMSPQNGISDAYYHQQFSQLRIPKTQLAAWQLEEQETDLKKRRHAGEWFWPGEQLKVFIREESAKQKLSQRGSRDDAAATCAGDRAAFEPEGCDSRAVRRSRRVRQRTGNLWRSEVVRD